MFAFDKKNIVLLSLMLVACDRSLEKKEEDLARTREKTDEKVAQATHRADDKVINAYDEANQKIARAEGTANRKAVELTAAIVETRDDLRKRTTERLGTLDKRLVNLRTKITTASTTKTPKPDLETQLTVLSTKSEGLRTSIANVSASSADTLAAAQADIDAQLAQLSKAIDDLEGRV